MATAKCPVCGADISIEQEDIVLFKRMRCPKCNAHLEIIDDSPLRLGRFDRG